VPTCCWTARRICQQMKSNRDSSRAADMDTEGDILAELLLNRQLPSGGWSFLGSRQSSVEATSLAVLALGLDAEDARRSGLAHLRAAQRADGSWPAFPGDSEGSWVTALALCTLNTTGDHAVDRDKALRWLNAERGREGHWFWRWKFKTVDRNVRFDPDKYGWPWISGSASWVIAIKQFTACNRSEASEKRIRLGVDMLLDRACIEGGWNSGNSVVYGVPLRAHIGATAIALLALQDERRSELIQRSLAWLKKERPASSLFPALGGAFSACSCTRSPLRRSRTDW